MAEQQQQPPTRVYIPATSEERTTVLFLWNKISELLPGGKNHPTYCQITEIVRQPHLSANDITLNVAFEVARDPDIVRIIQEIVRLMKEMTTRTPEQDAGMHALSHLMAGLQFVNK